MARGWESKSVEAQQDAAAEKRRTGLPVSPEMSEQQRHRMTLMLARTHALGQLQQACAPAYRAMLEQAIAELDREIEALR